MIVGGEGRGGEGGGEKTASCLARRLLLLHARKKEEEEEEEEACPEATGEIFCHRGLLSPPPTSLVR